MLSYDSARKRYMVQLAEAQGRWDARCEVCGHRAATEIHHQKGKVGSLLTDARFFVGVCRRCHHRITVRPEWASKYGYSEARVS